MIISFLRVYCTNLTSRKAELFSAQMQFSALWLWTLSWIFLLKICLSISTFIPSRRFRHFSSNKHVRGVISEVYPAVVSVFPTTEGYTSSCKDKASQKLRMDPNRNYLQLPKTKKNKKTKETETTWERKHNPQKAVVDEKLG